jgi:hypothetical protein
VFKGGRTYISIEGGPTPPPEDFIRYVVSNRACGRKRQPPEESEAIAEYLRWLDTSLKRDVVSGIRRDLERAYASADAHAARQHMIASVPIDRLFVPLRGHPRFDALLRAIGAPRALGGTDRTAAASQLSLRDH